MLILIVKISASFVLGQRRHDALRFRRDAVYDPLKPSNADFRILCCKSLYDGNVIFAVVDMPLETPSRNLSRRPASPSFSWLDLERTIQFGPAFVKLRLLMPGFRRFQAYRFQPFDSFLDGSVDIFLKPQHQGFRKSFRYK